MIQSQSNVSIEHGVDRLEQILREAIDRHAQLLQCIKTQQDALRKADTAQLAKQLAAERDLVDAIDAMEQRRKVVTATLATRLNVSAQGEVRLADLVEALQDNDPEAADRIARLGASLRESLLQTQHEGGVLRESCTALLGHVGGLMQKIQVGLSETKVYGRDGRVGKAPRNPDRIDMRS